MDKESLLAPRLPEDDVEIPGVGTFRVRALSRFEVLAAQKEQSKGPGFMERRMLAFGIIGPFTLTEDEVAAWQKASPAGEMEPLAERIAELSGMKSGAHKEAYKSVRGEPGA